MMITNGQAFIERRIKSRKDFCERRDSNPHTEVLVPKTSVYTNFTTLAKNGYEPQRLRTFDPQIKSLLLYQLS